MRFGIRMRVALLGALLLGATGSAILHGQIPHDRGQNVVPVYEGWLRNADGSFDMLFGYYNRNYKEELNIPIGPDNGFETGEPDQDQPTYFYPRRQWYVFRVRVPSDWESKDLVWVLRSRGKTEKTFGSLHPLWELDTELIVKNKGGATLRLDLIKTDRPPSVTISPVPPVAFPAKASVTALVSDDGLPRPARGSARQIVQGVNIEDARPQLPPGLTITWTQYRGPGSVTFEPPGATAVKAERASVAATFSEPGTYVLRATVSDGLLDTDQNVTVTVNPPSSHP